MHDTHLIEKLYRSIVILCRQNGITQVNYIEIEVDQGSHMEAEHLLAHLVDRDHTFFGEWTTVHMEYKPHGKLTAVITSIEGTQE